MKLTHQIIMLCLLIFAMACPAAKDEATIVKNGVVSCAKQAAVEQFVPLADQILVRSTAGDGKIDWPSVEDATKSLKEVGWCAVEVAMSRLLTHVAKAGGIMSSGVKFNVVDAETNLARLRASKFGSTKFEVE